MGLLITLLPDRNSRFEMDLERYVKLGKDCGLEGKELLAFAVQQRDSALEQERIHDQAEREDRRLRREEELRIREEEQKKLEEITKQKALELKIKECKRDSAVTTGGITSKVPCMPAFRADADDLDSYLERFERHAALSKWPDECWATALGNLLTGPALGVYSSMSAADASDYKLLKGLLLQHFALTGDGMWKRFRDARKGKNESYFQYAARLNSYVTRSIELSDKETTFENLREFIVKQHIYETSDRALSMFLRERDPKDTGEVVSLAEQYRIAHGSAVEGTNRRARYNENTRKDSSSEGKDRHVNSASSNREKTCFNCHKVGHFANGCPELKGNKSRNFSKSQDAFKKTINAACIVGVCPKGAPTAESGEGDSASVKLICGHKLPLLSAGCTVGMNMPTRQGLVNGKHVEVLRDTGSSTVIVRDNLVHPDQYTGEKEACLLIDGTVRVGNIAAINIDTPYFVGQAKALCMTSPIYDLIIGNISGARKPSEPNQDWDGGDPPKSADTAGESCNTERSTQGPDPTKVGNECTKPDSELKIDPITDPVEETDPMEESDPIEVSDPIEESDPTEETDPVSDNKVNSDLNFTLNSDLEPVTESTSGQEGNVERESENSPPSEGAMADGQTATEQDQDVKVKYQGASVETRGMKERKGKPLKSLVTGDVPGKIATRTELIDAQQADETLRKLRQFAETGESKIVGKGNEVRFFFKNGILFREYRSPVIEHGKLFTQLVVPKQFRRQVLRLAHDAPLAGHLKTRKTYDRVVSQFFWPGLQADVKRYVASCDACQRTTPKGRIGKVPLVTPPLIDTCFRRIAVDLIGPLDPVTDRGNRYILTIVDLATRYPEAVALPRIEAERVAEAMVDVFSRLGVPNEILSDNGTQFISGVMKEASHLLGVTQFHTTPYHPMANGACERFNGTLKQMLRRMCQERPKDWDRFLPALLFAYREVPHESLGYSPFELMYGRTVRGPMAVLKELWSEDVPEDEVKTTYQYVIDLQERLETTCDVARQELTKASAKYKKHFDVRAKERRFECGDRVLLLLPTSANKLLMQWRGPFEVVKKVAKNNYKLMVGEKEKTYHANLLKRYVRRENDKEDEADQQPVQCSAVQVVVEDDYDAGAADITFPSTKQTESVSDVKIGDDVDADKTKQVRELLTEFSDVLTDVPGKTDIISHSIQLTSKEHIRSRPYPVPQSLRDTIEDEVQTMLEMGVIEKSTSPYASPVVIVKKKDGKNRFCVDYRKINAVTVIDNEPIPNMDDLIANVGDAKVFTKIDLSKGYWQIPVIDEDREKTAFVTTSGQYQFRVLPFGMVNAPALFTRMMRSLLHGLPNVVHYIDDILIYSPTWDEHVDDVRRVLERIREAHLTARPTKCDVGCSKVEFLGHIVGQGEVIPLPDKIKKALTTTRPTTKKEVRSFLGLVGYYRKYIPHMSTIATPLTDLTRKNEPTKVNWKAEHEHAFSTLKDRLCNYPILRLPDATKEFVLRTDASDVGIGAVLMQSDEGKYFPICYASRKLLARERVYSVVERECLALAWAVKKFEYFLYGRRFTLQTDHFPLAYLSQARMKNPRVMRWALALQSHNFHVEVIPGSQNHGADFLSRCPEK